MPIPIKGREMLWYVVYMAWCFWHYWRIEQTLADLEASADMPTKHNLRRVDIQLFVWFRLRETSRMVEVRVSQGWGFGVLGVGDQLVLSSHGVPNTPHRT